MRKDFAEQFAAEGQRAGEGLTHLREHAVDALELALKEAPESSARERYRYAIEIVLPLLIELEDPGERRAAIEDVATALKLKVRDLSKALDSLSDAVNTKKKQQAAETNEPEVAQKEIDECVGRPGVLDRYVEDIATVQGVVGEHASLKLIALCALGAQLAELPNGKPAGASLVLIAGAGRGKNYLCDAVATLLPDGFYLAFESASAKALYYRAEKDPTIIKHHWLYPNEAEATDLLVETLRPLLSGGKATHHTVNKDASGRNAAQDLNVEGPVTATIPTVRNKLDSQLQTRLLVAELTDYEGRVAAHSRAFSRLLLPDYATVDHTSLINIWHASLKSLTSVRRVVFPLDRREFCFDSDEVSHGARLWANLLSLMLTHAWLEQRNRELIELSSSEHAVVATPEDYEAAYAIFKATCERSVVNLSETHRKILNAAYKLRQERGPGTGFSQRKLGDAAGLHHSTVGEQKTYLTKSVKLLHEVEGGLALVADAEPSWWEKGDLLVGLPRPSRVWQWWEEGEPWHSSESARHTRHLSQEGVKPNNYGEKAGRASTRQCSVAIRHPEASSPVAVGAGPLAADVPTTENTLDNVNGSGDKPVAGVAGDLDADDVEEF